MPYRLKRKETVADGICRVALEQFDAAERALRASHQPAVIHGARKRLKMLRAVLRLARPAIDDAAFDRENHALRDIGRTLSRLRDADVFVDVIADLKPEGADAAFQAVVARVRQHQRSVWREVGGTDTIAQARRDILLAQERVQEWVSDDIGAGTIAKGLRGSFKRAQRSGESARRSRNDERWHEWRKRSKDFWYHLRLVRSVWPAIMDGAIGQFKSLADVLGDDHDLAVVTGRLRSFAPERNAARELGRLRHAIGRRRETLQQEARELGRCLFSGTPRTMTDRFEACWDDWRS